MRSIPASDAIQPQRTGQLSRQHLHAEFRPGAEDDGGPAGEHRRKEVEIGHVGEADEAAAEGLPPGDLDGDAAHVLPTVPGSPRLTIP